MIQWLCIIIGAMGATFSAVMHYKIQNASAITPITNVDENTAKVDGKLSIHEKLDPVKLMSQREINSNKTGNN